jgi:hypothetical protein
MSAQTPSVTTSKPVLTEEEKREAHVGRCLKLYRMGLRKALDGEGSPREAIKAKCLDCCNWERAEVASCTVVICPLWRWRPYQPGTQDETEPAGE